MNFFIPSGEITVKTGKFVKRLYSLALLVEVPKPDFSMPFNALCLACTAIALLFGNMHSACTKEVQIAGFETKKPIYQLIDKVKEKFQTMRNKKSKKEEEPLQKENLDSNPDDTGDKI